jgi:hypothetical protein
MYLPTYFSATGEVPVANHLTPSELADELRMNREDVIGKCVQMGIPIFHGRIDKTLFETSLRHLIDEPERPAVAGTSLK